jgi:hypothetical protein
MILVVSLNSRARYKIRMLKLEPTNYINFLTLHIHWNVDLSNYMSTLHFSTCLPTIFPMLIRFYLNLLVFSALEAIKSTCYSTAILD